MSEIDEVPFKIGHDEALVLFELIADFDTQQALEITGPAERLALIRLYGALEKTLVEPFMPDYKQRLEGARSRLIADLGTNISEEHPPDED